MDYNALTIILTCVGIQFGFSWNYHRVYLRLYDDFKVPLNGVKEKRMKKFFDNLRIMMLLANGDTTDEQGKKIMDYELKAGEYSAKIKELYSNVRQAEEPLNIYTKARDSVRAANRYFLISGICTLLGLIPAVFGGQTLGLFYFVFLLPLLMAVSAWVDYSDAEKKIVDIRDKGE